MTAPSTAYHNQKLLAGVGKPDTTLDMGTVREMQIAKFIQNTSTDSGDGYFNAADDLATRVSKIKGIFKLDKLYPVPLGTDIGFIGIVEGDVNNYPVSANAMYHNQVRFSAIPMVSGTDGKLYILLLDGGLNIKPHSGVIQDHINQVWWANMYSVRIYVQSAFYAATTLVGYEYKINSGAWTTGSSRIISLAAKESDYYEFRQEDFGADTTQTIYLRAFAENEEGKRVDSAIYSHALAEKISHLLALKIINLNDTTGTSTEIFMTTDDEALIPSLTTSSQSLGIEGFTSDLMSTEIADGLYKGLYPAYPNRVYYYSGGEFTYYDNATSTDEEGLPIGMPRLYKNFAFALVDDTSATGLITDTSAYPTVMEISLGATSISASVTIDGQGTGFGRYADIYLRRTNAETPSVDEDIFVATEYIEPNVSYNTSYSCALGSEAIEYDKFSFIEII